MRLLNRLRMLSRMLCVARRKVCTFRAISSVLKAISKLLAVVNFQRARLVAASQLSIDVRALPVRSPPFSSSFSSFSAQSCSASLASSRIYETKHARATESTTPEACHRVFYRPAACSTAIPHVRCKEMLPWQQTQPFRRSVSVSYRKPVFAPPESAVFSIRVETLIAWLYVPSSVST